MVVFIVIDTKLRSNEMTREDIFKLLNKHQDNDTLDIKTAKEMVNIIYNEHEAQLKVKDEDLKLAMDLSEHMLDELKTERGIKEYLAKGLKAKNDEIELLKFIVEESIKKPMGVEPHSWSDYKMLNDNL